MNNKVFKVVARYTDISNTTGWMPRGKIGNQFKKRIYTSEEDFKKYGIKWLENWKQFCDVSAYQLIDDKWEEVMWK
jgi:hypothetical protein